MSLRLLAQPCGNGLPWPDCIRSKNYWNNLHVHWGHVCPYQQLHTEIRRWPLETVLLQQVYIAGQESGENLFSSPRTLGGWWELSQGCYRSLAPGTCDNRGDGKFGRMANLRFSLISDFCGAELQHSVRNGPLSTEHQLKTHLIIPRENASKK